MNDGVFSPDASREPIRFSLRTYTAEEIAEINERMGRRGTGAFRSAEKLLADIAAGKRPSYRNAAAWYYHPDERVQLALLARRDLTPKPNCRPNARFRLLAVWATAYAQAEREGVAWTPVLDYILSECRFWPLRDAASDVLNSSEFAEYVLRRRDAKPPRYREIWKQSELLRDWIRDGSLERVRRLLQFRSDEFVGSVLRDALGLSPQILREILEERPGLGPIGMRNRDFTPEHRAVVVDWAIDDLSRAEGRFWALLSTDPNVDKWKQAYGARTLLEIGLYAPMGPLKGRPIYTDEQINRLLSLLDREGDPVIGPARLAALILVTQTDHQLQTSDLLRLVPHLVPGSSEFMQLARAAHATPEVWKACFEHGRADYLHKVIADLPAAVQAPEIRSMLAQSRSADVLERLVPDAADAEFVRLFRRLARLDPIRAANVLEQNPHRCSLLRRNDLLPLLKAPNQRVRLAAITAMGEAKDGIAPRVAERRTERK